MNLTFHLLDLILGIFKMVIIEAIVIGASGKKLIKLRNGKRIKLKLRKTGRGIKRTLRKGNRFGTRINNNLTDYLRINRREALRMRPRGRIRF